MKRYCIILGVCDPDNLPSEQVIDRIMVAVAKDGIRLTKGIAVLKDEVSIKTERTPVD